MKQLNKYFVFSDVHGEYDALIQGLQEAGYEEHNPNHKLISIGDAFDRGPDSNKVYRFLMSHGAICIKGNHDTFFQEYLEKGMDGEFVLFNILHNGLGATIQSFTGCTFDVVDSATLHRMRGTISRDVLGYIQKMPLYYETQNFIFVHAGLHPHVEDWKSNDEHFMLWDIDYSHSQMPLLNKCLVIGHHHAFRVRKHIEAEGVKPQEVERYTYETRADGLTTMRHPRAYGNTDQHRPVLNGNKIAIDGCTNLTRKVNVLVIEDYPVDTNKTEEPTPQQDHTTIKYSNDGIFTTTADLNGTTTRWTVNYGEVVGDRNFFAQEGENMIKKYTHTDPEKKISVVVIKDIWNNTIAKGIAKCSPDDTYSEEAGLRLANARAWLKYYKKAQKAEERNKAYGEGWIAHGQEEVAKATKNLETIGNKLSGLEAELEEILKGL